MRQLRMLPKILIVTSLFCIPSFLLVGLYVVELNKSISLIRTERIGIEQVNVVQGLRKNLDCIDRCNAWRFRAMQMQGSRTLPYAKR